MKQHITMEQSKELNRTGKDRLHDWFFKKEIEPCLLSIGQMIEYLEENLKIEPDYYEHQGAHRIEGTEVTVDWPENKELCDELWEECKEILET